MALYTQKIGTAFPHGFAGSYASQPDMIVATLPAGGEANIPFGTPLKLYNGTVVPMGSGDTGAAFLGFASKEIKTAVNYLEQGTGVYAPAEPVSVFQRGCINVKCQRGTPAYGGAVYLRVTANASYPTAAVGGLEASADSDKTVQLANCAWQGAADADGIAELRILSMMQPGETYTLPAATTAAIGGVKQGVAVADAASTAPTAAEFKALLDSLRTAGVIATSN